MSSTPATDRLENSPEEEALELCPARPQLPAMTLASVVGLGLFAYVCWVLMAEPWRWVVAPPLAAYGLLLARSNLRRLNGTRVRADADGLSLNSGPHAERYDRHVFWDDVARCAVERRYTWDENSGDRPSRFLVLKDATGGDLFVLHPQFLSRDDLARLLRFIRTELERRDALFDVPAKWYER